MIYLPASHPLYLTLQELLATTAGAGENKDGLTLERLPAARPVFRLTWPDGRGAVVGKFYSSYPPATPQDFSLAQEYMIYRQASAWGLTDFPPSIPACLGHQPRLRLGLLLKDVPAPDLDFWLVKAATADKLDHLLPQLDKLACLLAFLHSRLPAGPPVSAAEALRYMLKLVRQLNQRGLLSSADRATLMAEAFAWERLFPLWPDHEVLIHGDATPTNFLFPDCRAVAVDLERLRLADRLWDLSWVAGELKHAWGWRSQNFAASEPAISHFFHAYLLAQGAVANLAPRLFAFNPFYMAMAELRIARNTYLSWEYRRELIAEAIRCLSSGRKQNL